MSRWLRTSLYRDTVRAMTNTEHRDAIAAEVRAQMARAGLTQADLAHLAHMTPQSLSKKLRGLTSFTVEELLRISGALGVSPAQLLPLYVEAVA